MNDTISATTPESDKTDVEVEVRMVDSTVYLGSIYIDKGGRILDYFNELSPFFALTERNGKVRIIAKAQVIQAIPYDRGDVSGQVSQQAGGSLL
jgi:hypothetical protein